MLEHRAILLNAQKWDLADKEWKYDQIPEIVNGKNVADWVDPDIEEKLKVCREA